MRACQRFSCDGRHYMVGTYRDDEDRLQMVLDILDHDSEREFLENPNPPNGWHPQIEAKRCPDCNPEAVAPVEEAAAVEKDEHDDAPEDGSRLWYQDR